MTTPTRAPPINRGYYAESSHARTLTTRDLRTPTAHIYFLQIVQSIFSLAGAATVGVGGKET